MILAILLIIAIFIVSKMFYFKNREQKHEQKCEHESNMFIGSTCNEDFLQFKEKEKNEEKKSKK